MSNTLTLLPIGSTLEECIELILYHRLTLCPLEYSIYIEIVCVTEAAVESGDELHKIHILPLKSGTSQLRPISA